MNQSYQLQDCRADISNPIRYHLTSVTLHEEQCFYFLHASLNDDFRCVYVGNDRERALQIYHLVVDGNVTPCTLEEVVEDEGVFAKADLIMCDKKTLDYIE